MGETRQKVAIEWQLIYTFNNLIKTKNIHPTSNNITNIKDLKTVNLIINGLNNPAFIVANEMTLLNAEKNQLYLKKEILANMGGTICFNTNFAKELLRIEKMSNEEISSILPSDTNLTAPYFSNYEDRLINAIAHFRGDKAVYFSFKPLFIYNKQTPSVTRFK